MEPKSDVSDAEDDGKKILSDQFNDAICHLFYHGPKSTFIHVSLFDRDSDQAIATSTRPDGTRDVMVGNRNGIFHHMVGKLTGAIPPSERDVKMLEAVVMDADGTLTRIDLSGGDDEDGQE
jgi:hypothetical protein